MSEVPLYMSSGVNFSLLERQRVSNPSSTPASPSSTSRPLSANAAVHPMVRVELWQGKLQDLKKGGVRLNRTLRPPETPANATSAGKGQRGGRGGFGWKKQGLDLPIGVFDRTQRHFLLLDLPQPAEPGQVWSR